MREIEINIAPIVGFMLGINYYDTSMEETESDGYIQTVQIMILFVCI